MLANFLLVSFLYTLYILTVHKHVDQSEYFTQDISISDQTLGVYKYISIFCEHTGKFGRGGRPKKENTTLAYILSE